MHGFANLPHKCAGKGNLLLYTDIISNYQLKAIIANLVLRNDMSLKNRSIQKRVNVVEHSFIVNRQIHYLLSTRDLSHP